MSPELAELAALAEHHRSWVDITTEPSRPGFGPISCVQFYRPGLTPKVFTARSEAEAVAAALQWARVAR